MIRQAALIPALLVLLSPGCARHHVVERDAGRVDGAKSISTGSDTHWTIRQEPSAAEPDKKTR
jgi:hypothetical protein